MNTETGARLLAQALLPADGLLAFNRTTKPQAALDEAPLESLLESRRDDARKSDILATLSSVEAFAELEDADLCLLADRFSQLVLSRGRVIYRQGDPSDAFYVVRNGAVSLYRDQPGKPLQLLARYKAGSFFGEQGILDGLPRSAAARTCADSRLLRIDKKDLLAFLDDRPAFELKLQMLTARRHSLNAAAALELGRRREVRIRLGVTVTLELEDGTRRPATLENLSQGGLSLSGAPADWQRHSGVRFTLIYRGDRLSLAGRIAWRQNDAVGVSFLHPQADLSYRVHRFQQLVRGIGSGSKAPPSCRLLAFSIASDDASHS